MKPFLRWAGGKNWLLKNIDKHLPQEIENYYEPFLGGGSVFFHLKSNNLIKNKSYLSDTNADLINTYRTIKNNVEELISVLKDFENNEEFYYKIRQKIFDNEIENAAKFLYLNKTSFNGIYRVNSKGEYNVPYGKRNLKDLIEIENLFEVSNALKNTYFSIKDFKKIKKSIKEGDFIFFDPPYTVAHENNGFIHYNQSLFAWKNQIQLSNLLDEIKEKNANFLITNAAHRSIYDLYENKGNLLTLSRSSTIGGKGAARTKYNEILLKNY